jgi:hypothetical protein
LYSHFPYECDVVASSAHINSTFIFTGWVFRQNILEIYFAFDADTIHGTRYIALYEPGVELCNSCICTLNNETLSPDTEDCFIQTIGRFCYG